MESVADMPGSHLNKGGGTSTSTNGGEGSLLCEDVFRVHRASSHPGHGHEAGRGGCRRLCRIKDRKGPAWHRVVKHAHHYDRAHGEEHYTAPELPTLPELYPSSRDVRTAHQGTTADEAAAVLKKEKKNKLPIVNDAGELVG